MECTFPERSALIAYIKECGTPYWTGNESLVAALDIKTASRPDAFPLVYSVVELPGWARDLGADGGILVPSHCIMAALDTQEPYARIDWWQAAFLMLSCFDEARWEELNGPAHSYSYRLKRFDPRVWERAWVNRIFLFLRRWAARNTGRDETAIFGALPPANVIMTHDVDAVSKTLSIRSKALAFDVFNGVVNLTRGDIAQFGKKVAEGAKFFLSAADYWCFPRIRELERRHGVQSRFYVYAGSESVGEAFTRVVFDPGYRIRKHPTLARTLRDLHDEGCEVGLHQSFGAWEDAARMENERMRLETALDLPITSCRQHWLRFSLKKTWSAQTAAGLTEDSTLGFNDRCGFRAAAALEAKPWSHNNARPHSLQAVPLVLMDSQFYDYQMLSDQSRRDTMEKWVREVREVHGTASVLWHQQVLSPDYGWDRGFTELLEIIQ